MELSPLTPNTTVKLLENVPFDDSMTDVLDFSSASAQYNFFNSKTRYTFTNLKPVRLQNAMQLPINQDSVLKCNYIMFQNANFSNKWLYAFITSVEFININLTLVHYKIDYWQTWQFDINIHTSFVEREHVSDDTIGLHTLPENLETGPYISTNQTELLINDLNVYILATESLDLSYWNEPQIVGGFPVPCYWTSLGSVSDFSASVLKIIIDTYTEAGKGDAIVAIFTAPSNFISTQSTIRTNNFVIPTKSLDDYTPRNNKLYTYPYCCLEFMSGSNSLELRYENFNNPSSGTNTITAIAGFGANLQVLAYPKNYEGKTDNLDYAITMKDFPICAWTSNYYQNWLAQNKASLMLNVGNSVASIGAGVGAMATTGGAIGAPLILSGAQSALNTMAQVYQNKIIPDQMHGSVTGGDILSVSKLNGFYVFCKSIKKEYAKSIDSYFDMFGYKVNTKKIPNIRGRQSWNYVKTIDCKITGNVPFDDLKQIKEMFNRGVTFWHGDYVGDYSRSNSIV